MSITITPKIIPWDTLDEDNTNADISYNGSNQFVVAEDGDYRFGGFACMYSASQRAQVVVEIYINGTPTGFQRGGSYIRNTGLAYDYWTIEFATEPFSLVNGDTVELRAGTVTGATYGYGSGPSVTLKGDKSKVWFERIGTGEKGDTGAAGADGKAGKDGADGAAGADGANYTTSHLMTFGPLANQSISGTFITVDTDWVLVEEPAADWTVSATGEITWENVEDATFLCTWSCGYTETGGTNNYVAELNMELNSVALLGSTKIVTVVAGTTLPIPGQVIVAVSENDVLRLRARINSGSGTGRVERFGTSLTIVRIA